MNVLLPDVANRNELAFAVGDGDAEVALGLKDSFGMVAKGTMAKVAEGLLRRVDYLDSPVFDDESASFGGSEAVMVTVVQRRKGGASPEIDLVDWQGQPIAVVGEFLRFLGARGCSPNTLRAYAYDLAHLWRFLDAHDLDWLGFEPKRAVDFLLQLRTTPARGRARIRGPILATSSGRHVARPPLSAPTVNRIVAATSSFYTRATTAGHFEGSHPIARADAPAIPYVTDRHRPFLKGISRHVVQPRVLRLKTVRRLPRALTDDQVASLFKALRYQCDIALVRLMLDGGLRPGEALGLRLEDVAYGRRRVIVRHREDHPRGVRSKSRTERTVDLHEAATLEAVNRYVMMERPPDVESRYLFLVGGRGARRGEPLFIRRTGSALRSRMHPGGHSRGRREPTCSASYACHADVGSRDAGTDATEATGTRLSRVHTAVHTCFRFHCRLGVQEGTRRGGDPERPQNESQQEDGQVSSGRRSPTLRPTVVPSPSFEHRHEAEYERFLRELDVTEQFRRMRQRWRREFTERWPAVDMWFSEPLQKRVGRLAGETQKTASYPASYRARSYLYYLALTDRIRLDYDFLLGVADLSVSDVARPLGIDFGVDSLVASGERMGYRRGSIAGSIRWALSRLVLHTGVRSPGALTRSHLVDFSQAIERFSRRDDIGPILGSRERIQNVTADWTVHVHRLQVLLHHRGQDIEPPPKLSRPRPARRSNQVAMHALVDQWLSIKSAVWQKTTVDHAAVSLRHFLWHLEQSAPDVQAFSAITREHGLSFIKRMAVEKTDRTGAPLSVTARRARIAAVCHFLSDASRWGWSDMPSHPVLDWRDLPRLPSRVPRFIPEGELARLMDAIRALRCPYQRAALLTVRWSGARRGEVSRLTLDCLDQYPDGTPRLRIPVGKTSRERMVPLHEEAAEALKAVIAQRRSASEVKVIDERTGDRVRFVFFRRGKRMSTTYLFDYPLRDASKKSGLRNTVTAHRFRRTVGTQLAERGAKLHTIMSVLGHESPHMSMVYARISDAEVLRDYRSVLAPGAIIAGRGARAIQSGQLTAGAVHWLRSNFLKTELELGHCLRLPSEGPCECDLYLNCAKFVTTPAYAPRLRERHKLELALAEDARKRDWPREVERHCSTAKRIECLLADLGESIEAEPA